MSNQFFGFMGPQDGADDVPTRLFLIRQMLRSEVMTATIARVVAVDTAAQTVDVVFLVSQVTPEGAEIPHATVHEVPYGHVQGGVCQIRIDPAVGDIGVVACAHRDITRVKRTRKAATPQTIRSHDEADAMWVGTLWAAGAPEHQIAMSPDSGIVVTSTKTVTIKANAEIDGDLKVTGDATIGGITFSRHIHPNGNQGNPTGAPENG